MIDKTIFQLFLNKVNDETINTQGITVNGNYVFVRINDISTMLETSEYNAFDVTEESFVAMAEIISQETPFVEDNNRSGWVKRFAFQFDVRDKDKVLTALQQVRDYFKSNSVQSVVDTVDEVDTTYKLNVKVSRPSFMGNQQGSGTVFSTYYMDFFADMVETGFYGNEAVHTMALSGGTKQALNEDTVDISSATATNPSNDITANANTTNKPVSRAVTINFTLNYDGSALHQTIRKIIEGKFTREQRLDYRKVFDGSTDDYDLIITGGTCIYKKGVLVQLVFGTVEYS